MKSPGKFFVSIFLVAILASLLFFITSGKAGAAAPGAGAQSPLLATAVSTHGNIAYIGGREESFQVTCTYCHSSHGSTNLSTILTTVVVNMSPFTMSGPVTFTSLTGMNSFDDGVSAPTSRICVTCHINSNRAGAATAMSHTGGVHTSGDFTQQDCTTCHPHDPDGDPNTVDGFMPVAGACNACHGAPPATGSHATHSNPATVPTVYGETGAHSTISAYDFSCGECHPTDVSMHRNGTVDVVLTSTDAPVGSIKEKNDVSASYDSSSKTCGGVYCHSGERVAPTGPVDWPLVNGAGDPIRDSHDNPTYVSYTSSTYREYAAPVWGAPLPDNGGPEGTCDACHQFPLTTSFRDGVMGGAVDSHQWIGPDTSWGGTWGSLHAYSYMADPIPCRTCHYQTITTTDSLTGAQRYVTNSFGDNLVVFGSLPIADHSYHVNGNADVAFDTTDNVVFYGGYSAVQMPVVGTYFPATKSCGNVSCHGYDLPNLIGKNIGGQNYVAWGSPYHIYESPAWEGCEFCHRPGGFGGKSYPVLAACNTCHPEMTAAPDAPPFAIRKSPAALFSSHPSNACAECHTPHMPDAAENPQVWTVDKIPPDTQIDSNPSDPAASTEAAFTFSSPDDATATFECSLDGADFSACTSGQSHSGLNDGPHTFDVRAKDAAGNTDPTPASFAWTIDTTAPDTQILTSPANPSFSPDATFTFTSPDPAATFECSLNGAAFSTCTSPRTYTGLVQGSSTFEVRAKDTLGNTDASPAAYSWMVYKVLSASFTSNAKNDGWILESKASSGVGKTMSKAGFLRVGDVGAKKQYRSILDFDTSNLPDNAVVIAAIVQVKKSGATGTDPFASLGLLLGDMKKGFFGTSLALQTMDFNAPGTPTSSVGQFDAAANNWYQMTVEAASLQYINLAGATQFRIRFSLAHDNDSAAEYVMFYSGNSATDKPVLAIQYYIP